MTENKLYELLYENLGETNHLKKIKHILTQISQDKKELDLTELIRHSVFNVFRDKSIASLSGKLYLKLAVTPSIYVKNYSHIDFHIRVLSERISNISEVEIDLISILPDYDKMELIQSEIIPINTQWEEINTLQQKLIQTIEICNSSIDCQNIGNISRTIMLKLANKVFDPKIHIPEKQDIDITEGKFKNQLHTYIDFKVSDKKDKEFRQLAESGIDFVEKSIDFMNKTTHKLNATANLAEMCVVSTITAISIIKMISELE